MRNNTLSCPKFNTFDGQRVLVGQRGSKLAHAIPGAAAGIQLELEDSQTSRLYLSLEKKKK